MERDQFFIRKLIIGLISSTEFIKAIRSIYQPKLIGSDMARRLGGWCIDYFDKYEKAPGKEIEAIYFEKLRKGLKKEVAEEIEQDILQSLNNEFLEREIDIPHLIDQARDYFAEQSLLKLSEKITDLVSSGETKEAIALATNYKPLLQEEDDSVDFSKENVLENVEKAFQDASTPIVHFPKAIGEFWDAQFVRGGFIAFLASEKRGKSFMLMDIAARAARQGNKVAFFQAGDMTRDQQIRRFCIHLAKASDMEKYCGDMYEPVVDCVRNQLDICQRPERECEFGVLFDAKFTEKDLRHNVTLAELKEAYINNPDYRPCYNCWEHKAYQLGTPWIKKIHISTPLTGKQARKIFHKFFVKENRQIMLSSHPNNTLSLSKMKTLLDLWRKKHNFVPDVIIVDYADLLAPDSKQGEYRHQQNEIWKGLRSLSQTEYQGKQPLVITATQADSKSYTSRKLMIENFSEDHRKNAHATAIFSLNQDPKGREKEIGLMRIGIIVLREGDFNPNDEVTILQNLRRGQPIISSYF